MSQCFHSLSHLKSVVHERRTHTHRHTLSIIENVRLTLLFWWAVVTHQHQSRFQSTTHHGISFTICACYTFDSEWCVSKPDIGVIQHQYEYLGLPDLSSFTVWIYVGYMFGYMLFIDFVYIHSIAIITELYSDLFTTKTIKNGLFVSCYRGQNIWN